MRTIVLSVQPRWLEKIISGKKTVEIRKAIPKTDGDIKVLLYCTKKGFQLYGNNISFKMLVDNLSKGLVPRVQPLNGTIVGEFTLKQTYLVENHDGYFHIQSDEKYLVNKIARESCLSFQDMQDYSEGKNVYAWVIDDLKVYDEPKTLQDYGLTRAPQSWCYVK